MRRVRPSAGPGRRPPGAPPQLQRPSRPRAPSAEVRSSAPVRRSRRARCGPSSPAGHPRERRPPSLQRPQPCVRSAELPSPRVLPPSQLAWPPFRLLPPPVSRPWRDASPPCGSPFSRPFSRPFARPCALPSRRPSPASRRASRPWLRALTTRRPRTTGRPRRDLARPASPVHRPVEYPDPAARRSASRRGRSVQRSRASRRYRRRPRHKSAPPGPCLRARAINPAARNPVLTAR